MQGRFLLFTVLLCCIPALAKAQYGVSIATGYGTHNIIPIRLGVQKDFGVKLCRKNANPDWPIGGYWEGSLYNIWGKKGVSRKVPNPNSNHHLTTAAFAGVIRVEKKDLWYCVWPYLDIGIGVSLVSKKEFQARELGMHFQFEDRFGLGIRFGARREFDIGYRVVHFSNAYLKDKNDSFNLHLIVLGYWF